MGVADDALPGDGAIGAEDLEEGRLRFYDSDSVSADVCELTEKVRHRTCTVSPWSGRVSGHRKFLWEQREVRV